MPRNKSIDDMRFLAGAVNVVIDKIYELPIEQIHSGFGVNKSKIRKNCL